MTRKTARITFLIEYEDKGHGPPDLSVHQLPVECGVLVRYGNPTIIGIPKMEVRDRPIHSLSNADIGNITGKMAMWGGTFARAFGQALYLADSRNVEKLTEEFWNFITSHLPKEN